MKAWRAVAGMIAAVTLSGCSALSAVHAAASNNTFRADNATCEPLDSGAKICGFLAYYGNSGDHPINVDTSGTVVEDTQGRTFATDQGNPGDASAPVTFELNPGAQQFMEWQVTLPADTKPAKIRWNGFTVGWVPPSPTPSPSTAPPPESRAPAVVTPQTSAPAPPAETAPSQPASAELSSLAPPPASLPPSPTRAPTSSPPPVIHTTHPAADSTNPQNGSGSIG
jgi:hypothetical protein